MGELDNLRILMLGWEFPPYKIGGLATHCYGLTKALSEKGVDVTFLLPYGTPEAHGFLKLVPINHKSPKGKKPKKEPYFVPNKRREIPLKFKDFYKCVRDYTARAPRFAARQNGCDVIHCQDWMTVLAGLKAKQVLKKPMVITMHSTEFDRTGQLCPHRMISQIEKRGMQAADRIITVSELTKQDLVRKYRIPEEKVRVVHNAFNPEDLSRGSHIRFGLNDRVVLFLGRLTVQKGCEFFLEAAKKVLSIKKNVRFIVVGFGDLFPAMINKAIDLGIYGEVLFTGFKQDVEDFYRMADVYVMPSVSEPFGITALEAVACGVPTIVSKQSGAAEVLPHSMKADYWDVDELANRIISLLNYKTLNSEMRENASRDIAETTWSTAAEKTINVYRELTA